MTKKSKAFLEFEEENEEYIKKIRDSIKEKVHYDLRQIIAISDRLRKKACTGEVNEYGDLIENWDQVETKDMINSLAEGSAWNFYSTPIRMNSFIESSLAEIIYKEEFNKILTNPSLTGTAGVKNATAELETEETKFIYLYRKMFTDYVIEMLKSFELFLKRIEQIIWMRQKEENTNPFKPN